MKIEIKNKQDLSRAINWQLRCLAASLANVENLEKLIDEVNPTVLDNQSSRESVYAKYNAHNLRRQLTAIRDHLKDAQIHLKELGSNARGCYPSSGKNPKKEN